MSPVSAGAPVEFVRDLRWTDVPARVRERVRLLLADLARGLRRRRRPAPASALAAAYASAVHPGDEATALLDGRRRRRGRGGVVQRRARQRPRLRRRPPPDEGPSRRGRHPCRARRRAARGRDRRGAAGRGRRRLRDRDPGRGRAARRATTATTRAAPGAASAPPPPPRGCSAWTPPRPHAIGLAEYHAPIAHIMRSRRAAGDDEGRVRLGRVGRGELRAHGGAGGFTAVRRGLPRRGRERPRQRLAARGALPQGVPVLPLVAGRDPRGAARRAASERFAAGRRRGGRRSGPSLPPTRSRRSCRRPPRRRSTTSSGRSRPLVATGGFTVDDVLGPWDDART